MDVRLFSYTLPPAQIAQEAVEPRDAARLLQLRRDVGAVSHHIVRDLPDLLDPGDLVVWNDTRVIPARIYGVKKTGGRVELLFLERRGVREQDEEWRVLLGASRAPKPGADIVLPGGVEARLLDGPDSAGRAVVRLPGPVDEFLRRHGRAPLPPYIRRTPDDPRSARDRERYQTVFAAKEGAVAAPTAGLHFTPELISRLADRGIERTAVTLHVGEGTFRPVTRRTTDEIALPPEYFEAPEAACAAIAAARGRGRRVVAVGTTVVRVLESRPSAADGSPAPGAGWTDLFIQPGRPFRYVDVLLTNFHLPRSTLLMLVSAFAGREAVLAAYTEAVQLGYRFYSFGDAMLIL